MKVTKNKYFIFLAIKKMTFTCKNQLKILNLNKIIGVRSKFNSLTFP